MGKLSTMKKLALVCGLYRPARFFKRHVLDRGGDLARFRRDMVFFASIIEPGALCFDVGANIGTKTEVLLGLGAKVIAFEPQPDCMRELGALCGHLAGLTTVEAALGSQRGQATLYVGENREHSSFLKHWVGRALKSYEVPATTLDDAILRFGVPAYCKIDVEGWEYEVIRALSQPIPLISFEYHLGARNIDRTIACLDHLASLGTLHVDITPAEVSAFYFESWMSYEDFRRFFPSHFQLEQGFHYGDIFVRTT